MTDTDGTCLSKEMCQLPQLARKRHRNTTERPMTQGVLKAYAVSYTPKSTSSILHGPFRHPFICQSKVSVCVCMSACTLLAELIDLGCSSLLTAKCCLLFPAPFTLHPPAFFHVMPCSLVPEWAFYLLPDYS